MKTQHKEQRKWVTIDPGEFYVTNSDIVIATLLGSCVSVCLRDPVNNVSGMNHFLLSNRRYSRDIPICQSEAGRYGINSMELVLNKMFRMGAQKNYLKAKAFGGGNVLPMSRGSSNFFLVGSVNVKFIKEFLQTEHIPLTASALGGDLGRVIRFYTGDFAVHVKNIGKLKNNDVSKRDRVFWESSIKKREEEEKNSPSTDLW